ncbi:MAG TPA: glycosyltransferase [Bryobacteraceae bacterium]|nr:glycosyltransferase [Bryobacteraceae bacterium]
MNRAFDIVILGLSITSSWGNGHATTYRSLVRGLRDRGHAVLFLERDVPWYSENRDIPAPPGAQTELYRDLEDLIARFESAVRDAKLVIVGSFVPEGVSVGEWVVSTAHGRTAFYDIDTPITLGKLAADDDEYISRALIRKYNAYFSFTGGPTLQIIERKYGSPMARELYCSVDPTSHYPVHCPSQWDLGYLGTYSEDRQPMLNTLLLEPAKEWDDGRFAVAGPMYPDSIVWPNNVSRIVHLSPQEHPSFYGAQRFTLNLTRTAMRQAGYSPSVRLFEAAACGVPIISDWWSGLDEIFEIGEELLVGSDPEDVLRLLWDLPTSERLRIGNAGLQRVLAEHTSERRACQLDHYLKELNDNLSPYTPRRNRLDGQDTGGMGRGIALERAGTAASEKVRSTVVEHADSSGLYEPD